MSTTPRTPATPETEIGRLMLVWLRGSFSEPFHAKLTETVVLIEQEARTLARTEVIAGLRAEVEALYPESALNWKDDVLAALSRLGERE